MNQQMILSLENLPFQYGRTLLCLPSFFLFIFSFCGCNLMSFFMCIFQNTNRFHFFSSLFLLLPKTLCFTSIERLIVCIYKFTLHVHSEDVVECRGLMHMQDQDEADEFQDRCATHVWS
ncbi:hypothetical protein L1049_008448 [Liquidambar formosana]|uniref:Uncharacterized protein n=1 Tax=Liquidambar formosana TaxID=63359 RepID=A0AAP0S9U5_LIQFO